MKSSFHFIVLLIIFSSKISASFLATKQGQEEVKVKELGGKVSLQEIEKSESMNELLMGIEACEDGDEECLKRRIISEAHLDYIYTQHHNP